MDRKKEFKKFVTILAAFIIGLVTVVASAGSISFGVEGSKTIYVIFGVLNLGWLYPLIKEVVKFAKENEN